MIRDRSIERRWFEVTVDRWCRGEATYDDMLKAHERMNRRPWHWHIKGFAFYMLKGRVPRRWEI